MKTFNLKLGAYNGTEEWRMKEYGSWEDHGEPETGHVFNVLEKMIEAINEGKKSIALTEEEIELLSKSIKYQAVTYDADFGEGPQVQNTLNGYLRRIGAIL